MTYTTGLEAWPRGIPVRLQALVRRLHAPWYGAVGCCVCWAVGYWRRALQAPGGRLEVWQAGRRDEGFDGGKRPQMAADRVVGSRVRAAGGCRGRIRESRGTGGGFEVAGTRRTPTARGNDPRQVRSTSCYSAPRARSSNHFRSMAFIHVEMISCHFLLPAVGSQAGSRICSCATAAWDPRSSHRDGVGRGVAGERCNGKWPPSNVWRRHHHHR